MRLDQYFSNPELLAAILNQAPYESYLGADSHLISFCF